MTAVCPRCLHRYAVPRAMDVSPDGLCADCHAAALPADRPSAAAALRVAVDAALTDAMPASLRVALEQALLEGVSRASLLALVRQVTGGPGAVPGGLTYLQCHGWLYPEDDNAPL